MSYCRKCGTEVTERAKYCSACGLPLRGSFAISGERLDYNSDEDSLTIKEIEVKFCSQCGEENFSDAKACVYCGVVFSGNEEVTRKSLPQKETIDQSKFAKQVQKPTHHPTALSWQAKQKQENGSPPKESIRTSHREKKQKKVSIKDQKSLRGRDELWKISALVGVLLVIGFVIIYSLDGFNNSTSVQTNVPAQSSQIDLSSFSEINNLEKALEKNPQNLDMILRLANLTHDAGLFQKSIGYYDQYLQKNPSNTDARVDMGVCYFELKNYDQAEKIFLQAVKQSPNHQIVHLNLGVLYLTKGEIEKAKDWLKKCVALGEQTDVGHRAAELLKSH